MAVSFVFNLVQWFDEVAHVGSPHLLTAPLEAVLSEAFDQTQLNVHVITGSLRGSGAVASEFDGDTWTGEISYGGPSPGFPNDPVEYAEYELARGGDHDFFASLPQYEEAMNDVIDHFFG